MAGPALPAARHPARAPADGVRLGPPRGLQPLRPLDGHRARTRRRRPADDQPERAASDPSADGLPVPPRRADPAQALPVGDDDVGVERGEPQGAADVPQAAAGRAVLQRDAQGVPRLHDRRRRRPGLQQHAAVAGGVQAPRPASAHLGPAQLRRHEPLQAAVGDRDAPAPARRQGRRLADRDRRHRPLLDPLPRREERRGARRASGEAHVRGGAVEQPDQALYLYHWDADQRFYTWDSAFVAANGRARPALDVLRRQINQERRRTHQPVVPTLPRFPEGEAPVQLSETRTARRWRAVRRLL